MTKKKKKQISPPKTIECIDCHSITGNFYSSSINKGKVYRCADCYERWVLRSTRIDVQYKDVEEQQ